MDSIDSVKTDQVSNSTTLTKENLVVIKPLSHPLPRKLSVILEKPIVNIKKLDLVKIKMDYNSFDDKDFENEGITGCRKVLAVSLMNRAHDLTIIIVTAIYTLFLIAQTI